MAATTWAVEAEVPVPVYGKGSAGQVRTPLGHNRFPSRLELVMVHQLCNKDPCYRGSKTASITLEGFKATQAHQFRSDCGRNL